MFHSYRPWSVTDADTPATLAEKLTQYTWSVSNGCRLGYYLFLNDSTGPDGAQEFGVIHEPTMRQVESITFSWCSEEEALKYIQEVLNGEYKPYTEPLDLTIQTPDVHEECALCA
jgi:hypothetical protein